jgi:hypothetical protein
MPAVALIGAFRRVILAGIVPLSLTLPALAGRPFATEDAAVLEPRSCELEAFVARETARGADRVSGISALVGCGIGVQTQLGLGIGQDKAGGQKTSAVEMVGKTALVQPQDGRVGVTLAYGIAASKEPGASLRRDSSALGAVATVPWQDAMLHANLGWSRSHSNGIDSTTWALAYERPWGRGVDVGAEAFGDDRSAGWLGLAVRWTVIEGLSFDASFAIQADSARAKLLTIGAKFAF